VGRNPHPFFFVCGVGAGPKAENQNQNLKPKNFNAMEKNIKITGMKGNFHMPIYNYKEIKSVIADINKDLAEVEDDIDECNILNKLPHLGMIFQHSYLSNIKKQYQELNLTVCN